MADLGEAGLRSAGRAGRSRQRMCCVCVVVLSFSLARLLLVRPVRQLLLLLLGQFETGPGGSLDSVGVGLGEPRAGERERGDFQTRRRGRECVRQYEYEMEGAALPQAPSPYPKLE